MTPDGDSRQHDEHDNESSDAKIDHLLLSWAKGRTDEAPTSLRLRLPRTREHEDRNRVLRSAAATAGAAAAIVLLAIGTVAIVAADRTHTTVENSEQSSADHPDQRYDFHGLSLRVPAGWKLNAARCGVPQRDTVILGGGNTLFCAAQRPFGVSAVSFSESPTKTDPGRPSNLRIGNEPAFVRRHDQRRIESGEQETLHVIDINVPGRQASIQIQSPNQRLGESIYKSIQINSADQNHCEAQTEKTSLSLASPRERGPILRPSDVKRIVVCAYRNGLLEGSVDVPHPSANRLSNALFRAPAGLSLAASKDDRTAACPRSATGGQASDASSFSLLLNVTLRNGKEEVIVARIGFCGLLGASDGRISVQRTDAVLAELTALPLSFGGWPASVTPVLPR